MSGRHEWPFKAEESPFREAGLQAGVSFDRLLTEDEENLWADYIDQTYGTDLRRRLDEYRAGRSS